jgi:hypothetical protein
LRGILKSAGKTAKRPRGSMLADDCNGVPASPILTCLANVEPREVAWLWRGRVPLGRITLLVGLPGEGKSFLTTDMAARVSTGTPWPDGSACPVGSVILISAEDDPGDTIRPRLDAHRANVDKIHLLAAVSLAGRGGQRERLVTLHDLDAIEGALRQLPDCKLIVVDPVGSFIGGRIDAHRDNEVRSVLAPVARLAEKYGPAVLVVAHRGKSRARIADDLALGSRAFTGIARAVWHLMHHPDDKKLRLLLPGKNNLAPEGGGRAFTILGQPPRISWEPGPVEMTADDALAAEGGNDRGKPGPEAVARNSAAEWLRGLLEAGPLDVAVIRDEAEAADHAWRTVQRASGELGINSYRQEFSGPRFWALPTDPACQIPDQERENLASWHDSKKPGQNGLLEPGTKGTCQDVPTWHDSEATGPAEHDPGQWGEL